MGALVLRFDHDDDALLAIEVDPVFDPWVLRCSHPVLTLLPARESHDMLEFTGRNVGEVLAKDFLSSWRTWR